MVIQIDNLLPNAIINLSPFIHVELCMLCYPAIIHIHTNYSILFKLPSKLDFLRLSVISSIYQNTSTTNTRGYKAKFSIKILSYHFLIESYTFFCIFCQARPRASLHDRQAIPRNAHATVGPEDEAGAQILFLTQQTAVTQAFYVSRLNESKSQYYVNNQVLLICTKPCLQSVSKLTGTPTVYA